MSIRGWLTEPLYYDFQYSLLIIPCQALIIHQPYHHRIPVLPLDKQPTNKEAQDYQAFVFVRSSGFIVNNDATITGGEFDIQTSFWNGFDLILSAHFQHAEVEGLEVAPSVFRDVRPAFAPETQLAGLARYTFPQSVFNGTLAIHMDAQYNSSFFHNIRNFDAQRTPSFEVGNARINWTSADGHWDGTVFVNNLADTRNRLIGFDVSNLCGCVTYSYGKPRWVGFSLRYNY